MTPATQAEEEMESQKRQAELRQAIAEAEQKIAEATKAKQVALAETQQAVAEAKQKTVEADRARLLAALPKSEMRGLEGTITTDEKFGYVAQVAGYRAAMEVAKDLAAMIDDVLKDHTNKPDLLIMEDLNLLVEDITCERLRATLTSLKELVTGQTNSNNSTYAEARRAIVAGTGEEAGRTGMAEIPISLAMLTMAPQALQSLVAIAADMMSFFKSDVDVKGKEFDIARQAVINELTGGLTKCKAWVLGLSLLHKKDGQGSTTSLATFADLLQARRELLESKAKLSAVTDQLKAQIAIDKEHPSAAPAINGHYRGRCEALRSVEIASATDTWLAAEVDEFVKLITAPGDANRPPLLVRATLLDCIRSLHDPYFLWVQVVSSGGEARMERRRFWRNPHVSFLGGGVISYVLTDHQGCVKSSGSQPFLGEIRHEMATNTAYEYQSVKLEYG